MVIVEVPGAHLCVVLDFDKSLLLALQGLAVSGVCQEQAHFFSLPAHRGIMGENVKDNHVAGIRIKPLQGHNVMSGELCGPGLLPGLRQHLPNGPHLSGQMVIRLDFPDHVHALLIGERTQLLQKTFRRVLSCLVLRIAPGHVNFIQGGVLARSLDLIRHPHFRFIQLH